MPFSPRLEHQSWPRAGWVSVMSGRVAEHRLSRDMFYCSWSHKCASCKGGHLQGRRSEGGPIEVQKLRACWSSMPLLWRSEIMTACFFSIYIYIFIYIYNYIWLAKWAVSNACSGLVWNLKLIVFVWTWHIMVCNWVNWIWDSDSSSPYWSARNWSKSWLPFSGASIDAKEHRTLTVYIYMSYYPKGKPNGTKFD